MKEKITKEQHSAIKNLNKALKRVHDLGIWIGAMDGTLMYATQECIDSCTNDADYSDVARCNQMNDEGAGHLYSEGYEDSGGW